ncbi:MAG: hypothetical protein RMK94_16985, partial [Armatimonadota bacterium]|nr:hypothetical protein [Armatimonadota bacterium]
EEERRELVHADLIVRGIREGQPTWLVVEVSGTIEFYDIERALKRSQLLARSTGENVLPVVAGELCPEEFLRDALRKGVWVILDGRTFAPTQIHR